MVAGVTQAQTATPGRRMRAADRREQLLRVAAQILSNPATVGASMDEIAAAAGVTKPVLYRHFPSKRALVQQVLSNGIDRLTIALQQSLVGAQTPREMVEAGFTAFFEFIESEPVAYELLFSGGVWTQSGFAEELLEFQTGMADSVSLLIAIPGIDDNLRRFLGAAMVGMCDHSARQWLQAGFQPPAKEAAADLAELVWAGLRGFEPRA